MSIRDELEAIREANGGILQAEAVVLWAKRNKRSALYSSLEWTDEKAAHEFRIWQVRRLIAIHITYEDGPRQVISLSIDRTKPGGGYRSIDDVKRVRIYYETALADALRELERVQAKYEWLKSLAPVWREVRKLRHSGASRSEKSATAV